MRNFYEINVMNLKLLENYAPLDERLIHVSSHTNAMDPFLIALLKIAPNRAYEGFDLLSLLKSVNTTLVRVFASHGYIMDTKDRAPSTDLSQEEIDAIVINQSLIILEYQYSLMTFFLKLRLATDHILRLFTDNKCSCVGKYFENKKNDTPYLEGSLETHEPFFAVLNATANFVKHDEGLLEMLRQLPATPSILIKINKNKKNRYDYERLKSYFKLKSTNINQIESSLLWVDCDYITKEFNNFKSTLQQL